MPVWCIPYLAMLKYPALRTITILFLALFIFHVSLAQQKSNKKKTPFVIGEVDTIYSKVLKQKRVINVHLPLSYNPDSATTYPVIYLLDGSIGEDFVHIVGLVDYMNMINILKPTIVVGIANIDRQHDFTFPTQDPEHQMFKIPNAGGSANFIRFIEKELEPYVEANYKTNGSKTLIGQSLGGLLATEILLKKPSLFTTYMIVSPSLWWNNESLLKDAPALLKRNSYSGIKVYLSVGTEGKRMEDDAAQLSALLKQNNIDQIFLPMPEENHLTILHRSIYKGFELLYKKPE